MSLSQEIKEFALREGASLVGVAAAERLEAAPSGSRPTDLLPGAEAVVVLALRIPRGCLRSANLRLYRNTVTHLEHELNRLAYDVSLFLEERGYLALPVTPDIPVDMERSAGLQGDLSHKHAAAAAGLGKIGNSTLLLTPQFGPRVRLVSVVTTAPLPADPEINGDVCRHCFSCVKACPAKAIGEDGGMDKLKCLRSSSPYGYGGLFRFLREFLDTEDKERKLEMLRQPRALELHQFLRVGNYSCASCVKVCPVGREPPPSPEAGQ
jgi:epoxyqueuosine reductase QueG